MMDLTWTKQMSVANEAIDSEHERLLIMVGNIERAIRAKDAAALSRTLQLFADSVRIHFRNEARLAEAIKYPFDDHKLEHQYVLNELEIMKNEVLGRNGRWSESAADHYYGFLSQWSVAHISEDDMKMKTILKTYPYSFKPSDAPE
jgi:hemerythrin